MSQSQSSQGDRSPNTSNVGRDVNIDSPTMNVHGGQGYQQGENQGKIYNATNITIQNYYYQEETKIAPSELAESDRVLPCPYRGLFHFGPHDADLFFGRDIFIEELDRATKHRNFIPVLGASGSGKSSVILAGLVPKLQQEGHWQFTHFRPGFDPFYALAEALVPLYRLDADSTDRITQADKLAESLQDGMPLSRVLSTIQNNHPQHRVLIVGDQFEEVYTLCNDEKVRRQFLDCLLGGLGIENSLSSSPIVWAIAMRADFLGNALFYPAFADVLQNPVMLRSMNREELTEAIVKPASSKVTFEAGLVERILNDVEEQPGNLPLLEFALTELWSKRTGGELTHQIYEEIEGVEGALARHADEKYGSLTEAEKENVRRIFIQLVRPGEGTEDTRRIAVKTELGEQNWLLVKQLADARLVVTSRNAARQETVEVVHEALIRNWGELRDWMNTDRVFRAWQERLRSLQRYWEESDRDSGLLLRGAALAEAEERLQERPDELMAEAEFIRLSIGDREKVEKEREARRRRDLRTAWGIAIGSLVAVVISGGLGWMAWERTQQAQLRERIAKIKQLAAQSEWLRDRYASSHNTGVLLAAEAYNRMQQEKHEMVEVDTALRNSLELLLEQIASIDHESVVGDVSFSPDGKYVATTSGKTVRISHTDNGETITRIDHASWVRAVSFSPDWKYVTTASWDETARISRTDNGETITRIFHKDSVNALSFSPDGKYVATASYDGTARISRTD
ncbi:MAG: WD40 repeat domain-containing protein, partial [Cyanobacteria bacterium P01_E01_bin.42]